MSANKDCNRAAIDRRMFVTGATGLGGVLLTGGMPQSALAAAPKFTVASRTIEVNGKAAKVFSVLGGDGKPGLMAQQGDRLTGGLMNASEQPFPMHWHGQLKVPPQQDRARPGGGMLEVGMTDAQDFELTPGTHWMHAHSLSEQQLLAAPMVTRESDAGSVQDVVVLLHDFSFRSPQEILATLKASPMRGMASGGGMADMMTGMTHANDVIYDAYLANERSFTDPEVVKVEKGAPVRLRIINGGTASAFFISVPRLASRCIAVDGNPCQPISRADYPLAQGQRIDLVVDIPQDGGAFAVLAQVEGLQFVTGIVLATSGAVIQRIAGTADKPQTLIGLDFETSLRAATPLVSRRANKDFMVKLGEEPGYRWTINGKIDDENKPMEVSAGQRVELNFMNLSMMMHPMHLHGHHFQVVGIGGRRLEGAMRDTVIVPPHTQVTVAFDAGQKGDWLMHCHHLYHMAGGMMTAVRVA